jgi:hypothetical protein
MNEPTTLLSASPMSGTGRYDLSTAFTPAGSPSIGGNKLLRFHIQIIDGALHTPKLNHCLNENTF